MSSPSPVTGVVQSEPRTELRLRAGVFFRSGAGRVTVAAVLLVVIVVVSAIKDSSSFTSTGLDLLLEGALPLVFAACAQMFVVLAGDIDLGLGYAIGLTNVISATLLVTHVWLGVIVLAGLVAAYALMALLTERSGVPAVVVTLGASFIWLGIALMIQPQPGGQAANWMESVLNGSFPLVPEPIWIIVATALVAWFLIRRWRYGVVLRGLGNNPTAIREVGRSPLMAKIVLYVMAGSCVVLAGLFTTVVSTASDANASSTVTLASVAAVLVGGAEFVGGVVEPVGTVIAAVALALLTSLLAFLNVSTQYETAAEGAILILAMLVRWAASRPASARTAS
jgi:ribose transport system ATP-binding protein